MTFQTISIIVLAIITLAGWSYVIWDIVQMVRWRKSLKAKPKKEESHG